MSQSVRSAEKSSGRGVAMGEVIYKGEHLERRLDGLLRKPIACQDCPLVKLSLVDPKGLADALEG